MKKATQSGSSAIVIILVIIGVIIGGFAVWRVYNNQQQQTQQSEPSTSTEPKPTDDELVIEASRAYCQSKAQAGTQMDFVVGKIGPNGKAVIYSTDKSFAKTNVRCVLSGLGGGGIEYVLGKKDDVWSVLYADIEDNPVKAQQFGVPTDFE